MGHASFYHLTRAPLEHSLALLLTKARAAGWRVAVRGTDLARLEWLDQKLWLGPDDAFLAHGLAGGPHDAHQPILLGVSGEMAHDPACLFSIDGAEVTAQEVERMERVCILFDGHDAQAVEQARGQWRMLKSAGCRAEYWSEENGRWEKQAET